ncbi:MAG TPA: MoxR family ATPase [Cellvibrionaceae bacterium]
MEPNTTPAKILQQLHEALAAGVIMPPSSLRLVLVSLLARGHLLLEDVPGVGKTTLAKRLAALVTVPFKRVQATMDLTPADLIGTSHYDSKTESQRFLPGPIFTSFLLLDELNRASPRTQAALLEAMAENTVSIERKTRPLAETFWVIATQNPVEFIGTFPLAEAQLDRFFMRVHLGYPSLSEEVKILLLAQSRQEAPMPVLNEESLVKLQALVTRIKVDNKILEYVARLAQATREHPRVRLGASPRASIDLVKACQAMALISGQSFVTPPMVVDLIKPVWGHRLVLRHAGERFETILDDIALKTAAPAMPKEPIKD